MSTTDTIFALATPLAKSGVAIIRISGNQALPALQRLTGRTNWQPNLATYVAFSRIKNHEPRTTIDSGLALFFAAPKSFTGEDTAELHLHGSIAVIRETLTVLSEMPGLRPAERGEFTRRAFLNGKMDLLEAEGLADLIDAETTLQKSQSLRQMAGGMSRYYEGLRTRILASLAHLEAYIDFPDEDIPETVLGNLKGDVKAIEATIGAVLADGKRGERLREGFSIIILGAPNAGKSSLLNTLAGRDAAIVSHRAGTTRDMIEVHMDIGGFPVVLVDTAGLRETTDDIEEEGVKRAMDRAATSDLTLIVFDASQPMDEASRGLINDNSLIIINKIDLSSASINRVEGLAISTKTGQGIDNLLTAIEQKISVSFGHTDAPLITRNRHRALLSQALSQLQSIAWQEPLEISCEKLRQAASAIGKITGKITADEILGVIFSEFCIGK